MFFGDEEHTSQKNVFFLYLGQTMHILWVASRVLLSMEPGDLTTRQIYTWQIYATDLRPMDLHLLTLDRSLNLTGLLADPVILWLWHCIVL
jgi:hypothetical protein